MNFVTTTFYKRVPWKYIWHLFMKELGLSNVNFVSTIFHIRVPWINTCQQFMEEQSHSNVVYVCDKIFQRFMTGQCLQLWWDNLLYCNAMYTFSWHCLGKCTATASFFSDNFVQDFLEVPNETIEPLDFSNPVESFFQHY